MASFNPYYKWLGIRPEQQPANHYRLLGVEDFEPDPEVIDGAAERQTVYLRTFQTGPNSELAERLLNEISAARVCLLDEKSKARYDQQLRAAVEPVPAEDPLGFTTERLAAVPSRSANRKVSRSRRKKPFWKEPWAIPAAAGGIVVLLLLLMMLFGSGEEPRGVRQGQEEELRAEIASLTEKLVAAGNGKGEENAELAKQNTELSQQNAELKEQIGNRSLNSSNIEEIPFELNSSENIKHPQFTYNLRGTYDGDIGMVLDPNKEIDLGKSWILRFTLTPPERPQKIRPFIVWGDNRPGLDALTIKYGEGLLSFSVMDCNNRSSKGGRLPVDLKMGAEIDISLEYSSRSKTIAITADGDREEVPLDFTPALDRESPLYIGIIQGYPGRFGGTVANFQFGNIEPPARRHSGLPAFLKQGLVAYYPFNGNANDESGNGNHGEVQGATLTSDRNSIPQQAFAFDGQSRIIIPDKEYLSGFASMTLSLWVHYSLPLDARSTAVQESLQGLVTKWGQNTSSDTYAIWLDRQGNYRTGNSLRTQSLTSLSAPLTINQWQQLVYIHDNKAGDTFYTNAMLVSRDITARGNISSSRVPLHIGADNLNGKAWRHFKGSIDDVRIYNRALSEEEVKSLYEFESRSSDESTASKDLVLPAQTVAANESPGDILARIEQSWSESPAQWTAIRSAINSTSIYEITNNEMNKREDLRLVIPELDGVTDYTLSFELEKFDTNSKTPFFIIGFPVANRGEFTGEYYLGYGRDGNSGRFRLFGPEPDRPQLAEVGKPQVSASFGKQPTVIRVRKNKITVFLSQIKIADYEIPRSEPTINNARPSLVFGINSGPGGGTARFRLHRLALQIP